MTKQLSQQSPFADCIQLFYWYIKIMHCCTPVRKSYTNLVYLVRDTKDMMISIFMLSEFGGSLNER